MSRTSAARVADVRRLLAGARAVAADAARLTAPLAESTGLSHEGVRRALAVNLEQDATDEELLQLVDAAGDAPLVHVILSANVFTAPLRALAVARAAAPRVVVRPSRREPVFTRALLEATGDDAIELVEELDVAAIEAGEIHAYGRDETIASIESRARVPVRGHGAGMGVALVGPSSPSDAPPGSSNDASLRAWAAALAEDLVAFDQRGCLSPRIALVEGSEARAHDFAAALSDALSSLAVPRGALDPTERAEALRFRHAVEFSGRVWVGAEHVIGVTSADAPLLLPPPGRHLHVSPFHDVSDVAERIAPFARAILAVGTTDLSRYHAMIPRHARVSAPGMMQRPPLDGPVDKRRA